jgi:hypothetical protein
VKLFSFDTEDDSRGKPLLVDFYDGKNHFTFTDTVKAWEWIAKQEPAQVWACNTEYDLLNLFGDWTAKVLTLQYVSSGLMRATMDESDVVFYDTLRHWPMSVEAMGKFIGKPKMKDYLSDRVTPKLKAACLRDTEIVYEFVRTMLSRYDSLNLQIKSTLPAMAMQYWNNCFNKWELPKLKQDLRDKFREGYYGGRVEVYRFGKINGPIYHYDINSLYPYVMKRFEYPDITRKEKKTNKPDFHKFGMANIDIEIPYHNIPCLPFRSNKEILFPYGKMKGVYCYPEIRQAIIDGGKVLKVHWAIEYDRGITPFTGYVDTCYQNRLESKTELDEKFWKLMMNSLYGKFGSKDSLLTLTGDREFIITTASRFSNVIWSAYVTCYARLVLLEKLRKADFHSDVYYTDTDSIFTSQVLKTSKELGALKLEGVYKRAEFFGNKVYVTDDVYRARGIPRKKEGLKDDPAKDFIRTGRCIFRRPARLRESRRSFAMANVWYQAEKKFKTVYTKRKIFKNGETNPLTLSSYKI